MEEAPRWFVAASESGLLVLLFAFTETMNETADDGRAIVTRYRFALEEFARYMEPDAVVGRIREFASSSDEQHQVVCGLYLRAFDRWKESGRSSSPRNLDEWTALEDR